jgi:hypothetical protein
MKYDELLKIYNEEIISLTGGAYRVSPATPKELEHLVPQSLKNFWDLPPNMQRIFRIASLIQGKVGNFVFQSSHGSQQIKLYEPEKYKNNRNTPLRIRARTIVHLASKEPVENRKNKIRELYRTFPFYLPKNEPVKLRVKNFYFSKELREGDSLRIYRASAPPSQDPELDKLHLEVSYSPGKSILFHYEEEKEQYFYALNLRNNSCSNLLHFSWQDDIKPLYAK